MRSFAAAVAAAAIVASVAPARAEDGVPEKARRLAARGRELHEQRDYARALAAFKEAYVLAPTPGLLFNLAQAYRLHGNCDDAAVLYRRYIASRPAGDERTIAQVHLATVRRCAQLRHLNLPLEGKLADLPPAPTERIEQLLAPPPVRARRFQQAGIAGLIGGGTVLASAAYFGVRAYDAALDGDRDKAEDSATTAKWLGITGGAVAITGLTLFLVGRYQERTPSITVAPVSSGGSVRLGWAF